MPSSPPLRRARYFSQRHLFTLRKLTLFPDAIHVTSWRFLKREDEVILLNAIERADLIAHSSKKGTRLLLRLKDGTKLTFGIPKQALWKQDINKLLNVPYTNPGRQTVV